MGGICNLLNSFIYREEVTRITQVSRNFLFMSALIHGKLAKFAVAGSYCEHWIKRWKPIKSICNFEVAMISTATVNQIKALRCSSTPRLGLPSKKGRFTVRSRIAIVQEYPGRVYHFIYRVTIQVVPNLPLTSKLKLRFSIWASY